MNFPHVLENVITTEDLESSHQVKLTPDKVEFLSIDIVNMRDLIGIEVDGPGHFVNILDYEVDDI